MPNVSDPQEVWRWIKSDHGELNDTFWLLKAWRGTGFTNVEWEQVQDVDEFVANLKILMTEHCSTHFGQLNGGPRVTVATWVWLLRTAWERSRKKEAPSVDTH